ncbi:threonylcarbamoyl-AMP synthase [Candidatus Sulfidibacterium hydrothermale]|uniref:L-threonylcarbamoyladenylate synthase n=1 Tax=Candidatus Sulfidibacterium hydrothermale TaxID=2875962 RepID=UPI001F0B4A21|nr:L-threonylcarbamoyladenylate synthase [Candidatus Sulfidibacterium hydrothermale]UBM63140.1 threonylcarbamoyl-AMP synthase [Candidatus Sulfidibacterium hydrothermale]
MLIKVYPENPAPRHIRAAVNILKKGGVVIFPTDTVYAMGCDLYYHKAFQRIEKIKGQSKAKNNFSIIVKDLSMLSQYTLPIDNSLFRLMKKNLPGPFTFILNANSQVPKLFQSKKRTLGVRIPDCQILIDIVEELGHPLVTTSIHDEDEIVEYTTDPELIHEKYGHLVDMVIDGGYGDNEASTVVDCTSGEPEIIRQGKGILIE